MGGDLTIGNLGACITPVTLNGTSTQNIDAAGYVDKFNALLTVNKASGEAVLLSELDLDSGQGMTIAEGSVNLAGQNLTVTGTFDLQDGGVFKFYGTETTTAPTIASGSTVRYVATSGNVVIQDWAYHHLRFSTNSDNYRLGATESIAGDLTIDSNVNFDLRGYSLTVTGTMNNNGGNIKLQGGESLTGTLDTDSGTVTFKGNGDASADTYTVTSFATTYNDLSIASTDAGDTFELGVDIDINDDFLLSSGIFDVTLSNRNMTIGGGILIRVVEHLHHGLQMYCSTLLEL